MRKMFLKVGAPIPIKKPEVIKANNDKESFLVHFLGTLQITLIFQRKLSDFRFLGYA